MRFASILCLTLSILGCSESSTPPTAPTLPVTTPSPQPKPPSYPPESWTLTASITSVTPHPCWRRDLTGLTYDFALIVRRGEPMRLLVYWDPTDGIEYVGSLSGQDFSLAGDFNRGSSFSIGCMSGGQVEVFLTGRVSGHFSNDSRSLSAEEVLSYRYVGTGEQVDVRYHWAATAPAE